MPALFDSDLAIVDFRCLSQKINEQLAFKLGMEISDDVNSIGVKLTLPIPLERPEIQMCMMHPCREAGLHELEHRVWKTVS